MPCQRPLDPGRRRGRGRTRLCARATRSGRAREPTSAGLVCGQSHARIRIGGSASIIASKSANTERRTDPHADCNLPSARVGVGRTMRPVGSWGLHLDPDENGLAGGRIRVGRRKPTARRRESTAWRFGGEGRSRRDRGAPRRGHMEYSIDNGSHKNSNVPLSACQGGGG